MTNQTQRQADALFLRLMPFLERRKLATKKKFWFSLFQTAKRTMYNSGCISYPRSRNHPEWSSIRQQVIDATIKAGFFEECRSKPGFSTHMSRLIPTPVLLKFAESDPWNFDPAASGIVELRDRETGVRIAFEIDEHPTPSRVFSQLDRINCVNLEYRITCRQTDAWGHVASRRLRPLHYAIFHDDWEHHGRIYTGKYGHQNLPKIERSTIEFDDEPSVELDYSGYHTRMLYHKKGIDFQHDPYRLWKRETTEDLRFVAKMVLNAAINATNRKATISACNLGMSTKTKEGQRKAGKALREAIQLYDAQRRMGVNFADVYDLALKRHGPISEYFGSGAGIELMTIDGKIALDVLYHFAKRSIPCLGIHDSFIVPRHAEAELRQVMMEVYEQCFGFLPVIK